MPTLIRSMFSASLVILFFCALVTRPFVKPPPGSKCDFFTRLSL